MLSTESFPRMLSAAFQERALTLLHVTRFARFSLIVFCSKCLRPLKRKRFSAFGPTSRNNGWAYVVIDAEKLWWFYHYCGNGGTLMKLLSLSYLILLFQIKLWTGNSFDYRIAPGHPSLTGTTHGKKRLALYSNTQKSLKYHYTKS